MFSESKPGGATYAIEISALVTGKAYIVAMTYILMLLGIKSLGTGT